MDRYDFMREALSEASIAKDKNEIPVGCVIVKDNRIIAKGHNKSEARKCAIYHAEMVAIEQASKILNSSNLSGCELYVTLEPCPMCTGAIVNSKISKVVFGAFDRNYGACGTAMNLLSADNLHKPECYGGVMEDECSSIIEDFFKKLRTRK